MMTQKKFMHRCVMASIFYALIAGLITFGALETVLPSSSLGFFALLGYLGLNFVFLIWLFKRFSVCLLYTSPSPRDRTRSRMPSSA